MNPTKAFKHLLRLVTGLTVGLGWCSSAHAVALEFKIVQPSTVQATTQPHSAVAQNSVALNFVPENQPLSTAQTLSTIVVNPAPSYAINALFAGNSNSLVAKTVGSAEGTRTVDGGYTGAYYGHVDPGNGVWNLGSFSYQHGAASPADADRKQLHRLQKQTKELRHQAQAKSFQLSLLEELNGIDLANQAPLAALDRGYIDWLYQARSMAIPERIVWARTKAFIDPDTGHWDAPGLGNHWDAIYQDQQRRYDAIAHSLEENPLLLTSK
ncbi:MAG: hypothetical protein KTR27_10110 [Leptolyngbyaceae cyanobacterium MAG.088]|nr:hypothetical protein [Leptolyngbyaceae cyanobacterium MAG.088]